MNTLCINTPAKNPLMCAHQAIPPTLTPPIHCMTPEYSWLMNHKIKYIKAGTWINIGKKKKNGTRVTILE